MYVITRLFSDTFLGAGAGVHLAGGSVSIFDLNLGVGVSTGKTEAADNKINSI